jgi:phosphoesterase, MJ0936 family
VHLLLISDTHARPLPTELWEVIDAVDVVVHAGDWVTTDLLDDLEAVADRVIGCYGNNDGPELRERLPEVARAELDGVRLAVVHETGPLQGREQRCARRFPDVDVLVFGHSHIPYDSTAPNGMRLLNPGSPTDRRRQPTFTWMTAEIAGGRLASVELHHKEPA